MSPSIDPSSPVHTIPSPNKSAFRAAIFGLLCVLGCAAGPPAVGAIVSVSGAATGRVWIVAAGLFTVAGGFLYRQRAGRRGC
jgi:hypothetical protein